MSKPRIGIDARHAARGLGISTFITELTTALAARGNMEPVWLGSPAVAPAGIEAVPVAGPYPLLDVKDAPKVVREQRLDLVLFGGNTGPVKAIGAPVVLVVHDLLFLRHVSPRQLRAFVGHAYERWNTPRAMRAADAVATVSETSGDALRAYQPGTAVEAIPHGIHGRAADGTPLVEGAICAFTGRDRRKRADVILGAYEALSAPRPPLVLFANAGIPADLEPIVERLQAANPVHVKRERLPRETVDATLAASLALVYCADEEGFGLPVTEGMAAGAPVITGLAPSTREVAGDAAALIDAADPVGSVRAHLQRLIDDPAAGDDLRRRGSERAAGFTWDAAAARYEALFDRVLARG